MTHTDMYKKVQEFFLIRDFTFTVSFARSQPPLNSLNINKFSLIRECLSTGEVLFVIRICQTNCKMLHLCKKGENSRIKENNNKETKKKKNKIKNVSLVC